MKKKSYLCTRKLKYCRHDNTEVLRKLFIINKLKTKRQKQ